MALSSPTQHCLPYLDLDSHDGALHAVRGKWIVHPFRPPTTTPSKISIPVVYVPRAAPVPLIRGDLELPDRKPALDQAGVPQLIRCRIDGRRPCAYLPSPKGPRPTVLASVIHQKPKKLRASYGAESMGKVHTRFCPIVTRRRAEDGPRLRRQRSKRAYPLCTVLLDRHHAGLQDSATKQALVWLETYLISARTRALIHNRGRENSRGMNVFNQE
ncbi:hypothetical protein V8F20_004673 [Naviculisporaceae sp. PSN 640]